MDHSKQLGEKSVGKLLLSFSIPAIVGMLVNALYNIVDRIFIGQGVGTLAISGITVDFPIMLVIMAFAMLIGLGATTLISIRLGENRKEEAERIVGNALTLFLIVSAAISVLGFAFLKDLLELFGASNEVLPYASDYMGIILFGVVFQMIGMGMNNFIRAEGNPKMAMWTMLIGAVLNTALDPVFIFVFRMGVRGAAVATVISMAVAAVWVLHYFLFSGKNTLKIRLVNLAPDPKTVRAIFAIGMAPFAMQLSSSLVVSVFNRSLSNYGGDVAIAAMGIINSIAMLILMPIFGINQGSQPIIGYNYGSRSYDRVKKALTLSMLAATVISSAGFFVTQFLSSQMIEAFNRNDPTLISVGAHGMRIYLMMLPIIGFQIAGSNYFQAVGKPKTAMFLSLSRQLIILVPMLLILPNFLGLDGVWTSGPIADGASSVMTGLFLFYELKKLTKKHLSESSGDMEA